MSDTVRILGIMSGSSLDGLDLATVEFVFNDEDAIEWTLLSSGTVPFSDGWQKKLEKSPNSTVFALNALDAELGKYIGEACLTHIENTGVTPDFVASHGHTVLHAPHHGYTLQIGTPSQIAAVSGLPTIADFRSNDIAHGGQGAPLAPIVEQYLFAGFQMYLNLGGIANLSAHANGSVKAWDICPCNQILNHLAMQNGTTYDEGGNLASTGQANEVLLTELRRVIELPHTNPFSLDNSFILTEFIPIFRHSTISLADKMATAVEYIADAISTQCIAQLENTDAEVPKTVLVTGGGAHNTFLSNLLREKLSTANIEVTIPSKEIVDFKEAILIALCGLLRLIEVPNALASVTGADRDTVNGGIFLPE